MKSLRFLFILPFLFLFFTVFSQSEESDEDIIYNTAESLPMFPGCEDKNEEDKKACADQKMLQFIYGNIEYPQEAKDNGTTGTPVIRFYVDTDGEIMDAEIVKDVADGIGEEALRIVESMPNFIPGMQDGNPVKVYFSLPVRFRLQ